MYTIEVSAVNDIGEGAKSKLDNVIAASVPMKLPTPTLTASSKGSITVSVATTSFDGGQPVTQYAFRRDDGPATLFLSQELSSFSTYTFSNLDMAGFYRVQVAAINNIGQGAWSEHIGFYVTEAPSDVLNLRATLMSETQITIEWD